MKKYLFVFSVVLVANAYVYAAEGNFFGSAQALYAQGKIPQISDFTHNMALPGKFVSWDSPDDLSDSLLIAAVTKDPVLGSEVHTAPFKAGTVVNASGTQAFLKSFTALKTNDTGDALITTQPPVPGHCSLDFSYRETVLSSGSKVLSVIVTAGSELVKPEADDGYTCTNVGSVVYAGYYPLSN